MQTDMHYFGTYALARAAGFRTDTALVIATSAEYVDDSDEVDVTTKDGVRIHSEPTAHHPADMSDNTDPQDQRRTWVPFHFIPGLVGASDEEKLICRTDSLPAQELISYVLANLDRPFAVPLLGILAHAFIDTFSHYGFSGISSKWNRVKSDTIKLNVSQEMSHSLGTRFGEFFARYAIGPFANMLVQLGHGSVATYPDQPYLRWQFEYESPNRMSGLRDNQKTFLQGCRRLHEVFTQARVKFGAGYEDKSAIRAFSDIEKTIAGILAIEKEALDRGKLWDSAMQAGKISALKESIPPYDPTKFTTDLRALGSYDSTFARKTLVYRFLEAAEFHRSFVLEKLLPTAGIKLQSTAIEWHSQVKP